MVRKLPPGRRPSTGTGGSSRMPPVYASSDFVTKATDEAEARGVGFSEFGRDALAYYIEHKGKKKENAFSFELNEVDTAELKKLADQLYYDDPSLLIKHLTRRALDFGPEIVREFMLGQANREVAAKVEAENDARAADKKKPAKKPRATSRMREAA